MHGRDGTLFPEARQAESNGDAPSATSSGDPAPGLLHVYALFLPPDIDAALDRLHRDYIAWWIAKDNPAWRRFPSREIAVCPSHDFVRVTVLREHADWWRGLFRAILPLSYSLGDSGAGRRRGRCGSSRPSSWAATRSDTSGGKSGGTPWSMAQRQLSFGLL
jgi:hypothetical protein